jgi:ribosomal-protein-alanine N-acetyltransferase
MSAQPERQVPVIRSMRPADLDAVVAIENDNYDFPWSRAIFGDCLLAGYLCIVLEADEGIIGYSIVSTAAAEGHILNLCIAPDQHRQGYGQQMLDYALDYARRQDIRRIFLEVRPSNHAAIALYEQSGFTRLGVRKNYYKAHEGREDALVLVRELNGAPEETLP